MRSSLILAILGTQALALAHAAYQGSDLKRFLRQTPALTSSHDMEQFKGVARRQMIAALLQAALLLIAPGCFIWGLTLGHLSPGDFVWLLMPSVAVILVARSYRGLENQIWNLPTEDPTLRDERDRVVKTWKSKPLPDW